MDGQKTDLNQLVIFAKVVETRSFTAAGRLLGLPKSTVSRKIAQLEDRLGVRLLRRTTRRIELTESGAAYHEHCVRITADIAEAERSLGRDRSRPQGLLRVALVRELGTRFFASLVADFLREQPDVDVELQLVGRSVELRSEGLDLVLDAEGRRELGVVTRPLGCLRRCRVAEPGYLATQSGERWLLGREQPGAAERTRLVVDDQALLREALLAGLGVGVLPIHECEAELDSGALVELHDESPLEAMAIYASYPTSRQLSTKVGAFLEFVQRRLAQFEPELDVESDSDAESDADAPALDSDVESDSSDVDSSDSLGAGLYAAHSSGSSATQP